MKAFHALQGSLAPSYQLYKDAKSNVAYTVPQGSDIEAFRKASADNHLQISVSLRLACVPVMQLLPSRAGQRC